MYAPLGHSELTWDLVIDCHNTTDDYITEMSLNSLRPGDIHHFKDTNFDCSSCLAYASKFYSYMFQYIPFLMSQYWLGAMTRTNVDLLLVGSLRTNLSEILTKIQTFSYKKCCWKCCLQNVNHFVSASRLNSGNKCRGMPDRTLNKKHFTNIIIPTRC